MSKLKQLKSLAEGFSVLYVEDNDALRSNASKLLKKFFHNVYVGADGEEGLKLFKEYHPLLVITDIKMPKLDGMELAKYIRHASPNTKVVFISAFDEKDHLYKAIEIGVFRFVKKPVSVNELSDVLSEAIKQIKHEANTRIFQSHLDSIFNYQSSMVVMLKHTIPIVANQPMLDFYGVDSVDELNEKYPDIGSKFLQHDGFLYNSSEGNWTNKILENHKKIFYVKMKDLNEKIRHFILKCQEIPDKNNYGILSFDDITELNLLELFSEKQSSQDELQNNTEAMYNLLKVIQRNNAKISIHNYYKGISITHDATIEKIENNELILKTSYVQQKALQFEKKCVLTSEALPSAIVTNDIVNIAFDKQQVVLKNLKFAKTSPVTREAIRLVPEDTHKVTMLIGDTKYSGELSIADISLNSVKLNMSLLPAGFDEGSEVILNMVFFSDKQSLAINTKAKVFRKQEYKQKFEVVFLFHLESKARSELVKYISKRQMAIIREFKGRQNG